jgi:hypothetical protein
MSTIIKSIYFPEQIFATKEDLFCALKKNEGLIIECKKQEIKSVDKGSLGCHGVLKGEVIAINEALKGIGFNAKQGYLYPIISTTNWFDTHKDVHFDPCFNKTAKEQQGKVFYCGDHDLSLKGILAKQSHVNMLVKSIPWQLVGKDYEGSTKALLFEIEESKMRADALDYIKTVPDAQNSIRMVYVTIKMGMNSSNEAHKVNKAYYESRIDEIANKDEVEKEGYFFGVEELKILKEGSLVVAGGSNSATSIYMPKIEAVIDTSRNIEPSNDTQKQLNIIKKLKF